MMRLPLLTTPAPSVALGIASGKVVGVAVKPRADGPTITAYSVEPLPPGSLVGALNARNVSDPDSLVSAIRRVYERLGVRPGRAGLVVPDTVGKVSLVRFDKTPSRKSDLDQMVRFQIRKTAPFRIEEAQVAYMPGAALPDGGREFVVVLAKREVVEEYEAVCAAAGVHVGFVELSTLNVVNTVLTGEDRPAGDWLLVHVTPDYASLAILRGDELVFFRSRSEDSDEALADLVHQTAMYHEDRLGGTRFSRVMLAGVRWTLGRQTSRGEAAGAEQLRLTLAERLGTRVDLIGPDKSVSVADGITLAPELFDLVAPLLGMLRREGQRRDAAGRKRMIHLNVATRPFYNERAIHALLVFVSLLVVGLAAFNVARIVTLSAEQHQLDSRAAQAEARAQEERRAADGIRRTIDAKQLEAISAAALEANGIIDQRVFSWTDLFNRLETTLPSNVRMTSITPRVDRDGRLFVSMVVVGRRVEDVDGFMENLETSGTFADLLSRQQSMNQAGLLETTLEGRYLGAPGESAAQPEE